MNLRQLLSDAAQEKETVLTLGVFDGVHLGHRHLLRRLVQLATPPLVPAVLTFSNHPITVLRPGSEVGYLSSPEHKLRLIKEQGVEVVVSVEFTKDLAQVTAQEFTAILAESLNMRGLVLGPDAALGRNREGDLAYLEKRGKELGFWVTTLEPFVCDGVAVKSRLIRSGIAQGEVAASAKMLSRNYAMTGTVVEGDRRGRELGFPTANLQVDKQLVMPGDGIYATWATVNGQRHPAATSIGIRPTFDLTERLVEVYIIDFDDDIYGKQVCVEFVSKLRGQEKFADVEELIKQIDRDVADAKAALAADKETELG